MKRPLTSLLIVASVLALHSVLATGQQKKRRATVSPASRPRTTETKPRPQVYSTTEFDASVASLAPTFRGHNAIEIYEALAERVKNSKKGEFETTEAYNQRLQTALLKPLTGSFTQRSIFAFVTSGSLEAQYDADKQVMSVKAELSKVHDGVELEEKRMAVLWDVVNREKGSYVGTNAYGAEVKVERSVADFYEIAFANYNRFPIVTYLDEISQQLLDERRKMNEKYGISTGLSSFEYLKKIGFSTTLQMNAEVAKHAKDNLRLLLICQLIEPPIIEGTSYSKPTFDRPRENFFRIHNLNTELLEVWFFNFSSGQIYEKQKPK